MEVIDKDDTHTPVFIACNDHYSGVPVSNYVLSALTERFENLYGIIDYGTNSEITNGVLDGCSDLVVLSANEAKYTSMPEEVGVEGIVSTIGNAFPSLVSSLYDI